MAKALPNKWMRFWSKAQTLSSLDIEACRAKLNLTKGIGRSARLGGAQHVAVQNFGINHGICVPFYLNDAKYLGGGAKLYAKYWAEGGKTIFLPPRSYTFLVSNPAQAVM